MSTFGFVPVVAPTLPLSTKAAAAVAAFVAGGTVPRIGSVPGWPQAPGRVLTGTEEWRVQQQWLDQLARLPLKWAQQAWDWLNQREVTAPGQWNNGSEVQFQQAGSVTVGMRVTVASAEGTWCGTTQKLAPSSYVATHPVWTRSNVVRVTLNNVSYTTTFVCATPNVQPYTNIGLTFHYVDGTSEQIDVIGGANEWAPGYSGSSTGSAEVTPFSFNGQPVTPPAPTRDPAWPGLPQGFVGPDPQPGTLPQRQPMAPPVPLPSTVPGADPVPLPGGDPVPLPPPDRRPMAPPQVIPSPSVVPVFVPGVTPGPGPGTDPTPGQAPFPLPTVPAPAPIVDPGTGQILQPIPGPVTTPVDVIDFDGQPIGGPGQQPQPTIEGIAQEVGRIERKLEIMRAAPKAPGDLTDSLQLLLQLLDLLNAVHPSGEYLLSGPCDFDENGEPQPPRVASWGPGLGIIGEVSKKVDALADLLQHHKELRQPTCKRGPVTGTPVTVLFEEV